MAGIITGMPEQFIFKTEIPVRITDINYGNHVGNDAVLSILHEARVQYLIHHGFQELNCGGPGLIMKDVTIDFRSEIKYGDTLVAGVAAANFTTVSFELFYRLEKKGTEKKSIVVNAKSTMVTYNYALQKISKVPDAVKEKLGGG